MDAPRKPGYWAVLPASVRYCEGLSATAKIVYAELSALTQMDGVANQDNAWFCRVLGISERTLQGHLRARTEGLYYHPGRGRRPGPPPDLRRDQSSRTQPRKKLRGWS